MKKLLATLGAAVLSTAMLFNASAFAATSFTHTPVAGDSSVTFAKYLVMDQEANVPNATFSFSIAAGTAQAAGTNTSAVLAGIDADKITIADAIFAPGDTQFASAQAKETSVKGPSGTVDEVELATGQVYARKAVAMDFSDVAFPEPGVYRYVLTENAGAEQGVTYDVEPRYLDVYIDSDDSGTLSVTGYVLHAQDAVVNADGTLVTGDSKDGGFANAYTTHDLTFSKAVTGNQASHDKYFKFTVEIEGAVDGTVYSVDLSDAVATVPSNDATLDAYEGQSNPDEMVVSGTSASADFYLQHGQSITIRGLADQTAYTITETAEDYDPAYSQDEGGAVTAEDGNTVSDAAMEADTVIAFTNERQGTIPTGIIMEVAPYAAVVLAGGLGAVYVISKKRKSADDDDEDIA